LYSVLTDLEHAECPSNVRSGKVEMFKLAFKVDRESV